MHYQQGLSYYYFSLLLFLCIITLLLPSVPARNLPSQVTSPRCGVPDHNELHKTEHYLFLTGWPNWERSTVPLMLSYALSPEHVINYINIPDILVAFERAFSKWSLVVPVTFTETKDYEQANITIGFYHGDHGDGSPFDNIVLAHATGPGSGASLHFNEAHTWAVDFSSEKSKDAYDLESIAVHEIGHVLGLNHSSIPEAVMWPYIGARTKNVDLALDDVNGVQALYGANPNFKFDSVKVKKHHASSFGFRKIIFNSIAGVSLLVSIAFAVKVFFCYRNKGQQNQIDIATSA